MLSRSCSNKPDLEAADNDSDTVCGGCYNPVVRFGRKWILCALTMLSLLLSVATVTLWLRSYGTWDCLYYSRFIHAPEGQTNAWYYASTDRGGAYLSRAGMFYPADSMSKNPGLLHIGAYDAGLQSTPSSGTYPYERIGVGVPELFRFAGFQLTTGFRPEPKDLYRRHRLTLVFPLWFVTLLTAIAPTRAALRHVRRSPTSPHRCSSCSYDLTGNMSGVCPECGMAMQVVS